MKIRKIYLNQYEKNVVHNGKEFKTVDKYLTLYTDDPTHPKIKLYYIDLLKAATSKLEYLNSVKPK
jgi:hypothetical protein